MIHKVPGGFSTMRPDAGERTTRLCVTDNLLMIGLFERETQKLVSVLMNRASSSVNNLANEIRVSAAV